MPAIVVGADHPLGGAIIAALGSREGEVRAFVSDPQTGATLKEQGIKVATGDVSDASHVGGASLNAFTAVLVMAAAVDGRETAFADDPAGVYRAWAEGVRAGGVRRVIWVDTPATPVPEGLLKASAPETAVVTGGGRPPAEVAAEVARLDDAAAF